MTEGIVCNSLSEISFMRAIAIIAAYAANSLSEPIHDANSSFIDGYLGSNAKAASSASSDVVMPSAQVGSDEHRVSDMQCGKFQLSYLLFKEVLRQLMVAPLCLSNLSNGREAHTIVKSIVCAVVEHGVCYGSIHLLAHLAKQRYHLRCLIHNR